MSKRNSHLLCLCGSPLNFDDFEYFCGSCGKVRFPRYVSNGNGEMDLIEAFNLVSKGRINVMEQYISEETSTVRYIVMIYTFKKKDQNYALIDIKEVTKVWEDTDPNIVSDDIQLLKEEIDADLCFSEE